jgi:3',5'-cyclic AMP phosphodiesterase CpdA
MATIAHLSDMHFGRHDDAVVAAVEAWLFERRPHLVVVSGDLTQRAKVEQYQLACAFLDRLEEGGLAVLAVPGNHDVPLYDIVRRFVRPLHRYQKYIDDDLCPYWENDELAVLGINTARSLTFKDGSVSHEQLQKIRDTFTGSEQKLRVLVTHHPLFALPIDEEGGLTKTAKRSDDALLAASDAGVDLLLAGHFHRSYSQAAPHAQATEQVENAGPALVIQAGTATSTRLRGDEPQSFNWIDARPDGVELAVQSWTDTAFESGAPVRFSYEGGYWRPVSREAV